MKNRNQHAGAAREARRAAYDPDARAKQPARLLRAQGYRYSSPRHIAARQKVDPARRAEIARMGGEARARRYRAERIQARRDARRQAREQLPRLK
jgi:hypothetical protein